MKSSGVLCTLPLDPFPCHCLSFPLFLVNIVHLGETDGAAMIGVERHRQLVVVPQRVRGALGLRHEGLVTSIMMVMDVMMMMLVTATTWPLCDLFEM